MLMSTPLNVPRWPPASAPCAMMASAPQASNVRASATVVALEMMKIPALLIACTISGAGKPKWKLTISGFARSSMPKCSRVTSLAAPLGWGTGPRPWGTHSGRRGRRRSG